MFVNGVSKGLLNYFTFHPAPDTCTSQSAESMPVDCDPDNGTDDYGEKIFMDPEIMKYFDDVVRQQGYNNLREVPGFFDASKRVRQRFKRINLQK